MELLIEEMKGERKKSRESINGLTDAILELARQGSKPLRGGGLNEKDNKHAHNIVISYEIKTT